MKVTKVSIKNDNGCCNFCDKGEITNKRTRLGLVYPYTYIFNFGCNTKSITASICDDCLAELIYKTELLKQVK